MNPGRQVSRPGTEPSPVYRSRVFSVRLEPRTALTTSDAIRYAMWPIAILSIVHRVLV